MTRYSLPAVTATPRLETGVFGGCDRPKAGSARMLVVFDNTDYKDSHLKALPWSMGESAICHSLILRQPRIITAETSLTLRVFVRITQLISVDQFWRGAAPQASFLLSR